MEVNTTDESRRDLIMDEAVERQEKELQEETGADSANGVGAKGNDGKGVGIDGKASNETTKGQKGTKANTSATSKKGKGAGSTTTNGGVGKDATASAAAAVASSSTGANPTFPLARVSRIVKLDRDVETTSKDAIWTIAVATEMFIKHLIDSTVARARLDKKKTVTYKELAATVEGQSELFFLQDVLPQPMTLQQAFDQRKSLDDENRARAVGLIIDEDTEEEAEEEEQEKEQEHEASLIQAVDTGNLQDSFEGEEQQQQESQSSKTKESAKGKSTTSKAKTSKSKGSSKSAASEDNPLQSTKSKQRKKTSAASAPAIDPIEASVPSEQTQDEEMLDS